MQLYSFYQQQYIQCLLVWICFRISEISPLFKIDKGHSQMDLTIWEAPFELDHYKKYRLHYNSTTIWITNLPLHLICPPCFIAACFYLARRCG